MHRIQMATLTLVAAAVASSFTSTARATDGALRSIERAAEEEVEEEKEVRPERYLGEEFGTLGASVIAQQFEFDNYRLGTAGDQPDMLHAADLRLTGSGWGYGGALRIAYESSGGFRFGFAVGATAIEGLSIKHAPLPNGVRLSNQRVIAVNLQGTFGKTIDARYIFPYADAKLSVNLVSTNIDLHTPEYGFIGTTQYLVPTVSLAPRLGAVIPLDANAFVDVSAEYGLFGAERFGTQLQLGVAFE